MKDTVFMIIKPDAVERKIEREMLKDIESRGFKIVCKEKRYIEREEAAVFYQEHSLKGFFNDLIDYMTSGEVVLLAVKVPSVDEARKQVGATDPAEAEEGTIRKKFGIEKSRNSIHCSDSDASANRELRLFFPVCKNLKLFKKPIEDSILFEFYANTDGVVTLIRTGREEEFPHLCCSYMESILFDNVSIG